MVTDRFRFSEGELSKVHWLVSELLDSEFLLHLKGFKPPELKIRGKVWDKIYTIWPSEDLNMLTIRKAEIAYKRLDERARQGVLSWLTLERAQELKNGLLRQSDEFEIQKREFMSGLMGFVNRCEELECSEFNVEGKRFKVFAAKVFVYMQRDRGDWRDVKMIECINDLNLNQKFFRGTREILTVVPDWRERVLAAAPKKAV